MIRRYSTPKKSRGTVIPAAERLYVHLRDGGCIGPRVRMPGECLGALSLDHVRASHGMGMKSSSERSNLVVLCGSHHLTRTLEGRKWRPLLLAYLSEKEVA